MHVWTHSGDRTSKQKEQLEALLFATPTLFWAQEAQSSAAQLLVKVFGPSRGIITWATKEPQSARAS